MLRRRTCSILFLLSLATAILAPSDFLKPVQIAPSTAQAATPAPQTTSQGKLDRDKDAFYSVAAVSQPGVYQDPSRRFLIRYPSAWRVLKAASGGYVRYTFSEEAGRVPLRQVRRGVVVQTVAMADLYRTQKFDAARLLKHILPAILRSNPGMKLVGEVTAAKLGTLPAATCVLQGTREEQTGTFTEEVFIAEQEGIAFQVNCFAPEEDYPWIRPAFLRIISDSQFGRTGLARRDQSMEARQIVQKYKGSVVSIYASNGRKAGTGSGFIVSRDGYVVTNYHVAYDTETGQPMTEFIVDWDDSLKRPKVPARLVGGSYRPAPFRVNYGVDVALLKIPPGDYEPMSLSPLSEVEAGDDVVTMGFPSRALLEGISLTVTRGVVTRFNRGAQGEVDSIYVDAAFTHGSSGGPCINLVTGGVIGLNSFGTDVILDKQFSKFNDLINYHGVVPIDAVLREFPFLNLPGLNPDGTGLDFLDCYALSKFFLSTGSLTAAEQMANRAVALDPQAVIGHQRLGECRFQQALDQESLGNAEAAKKTLEAARRSYEEALRCDPKHADSLVSFADLETHAGRLNEALSLTSRAIQSDPKHWPAHLAQADLLARQSRFDEALRHVERAKEVTGGIIVNPHMTAGAIYYAKRDFENGKKEFLEASRISPVYLPARIGVAEYYENINQVDAAVAEYQRILNDFRENGAVLGRIGICLNKAGRPAEAIQYFRRSMDRSQAAGEAPGEHVLLQLGGILLGSQKAVEAILPYALYLTHYPRGQWSSGTSLRLAAIHAQHGAAGLASAHARLAVALQNTPDVQREAQRFQMSPLTLNEIKALLQLQYPVPLAAGLITNSPLAFSIKNEEQLQQLRKEGLPEPILQAIVTSLTQQPAQRPSPPQPQPSQPPGALPPGSLPFPPENTPPPPGFSPGPVEAALRAIWSADGATPQGFPTRCVFILGSANIYTSQIFVNFQSLGIVTGTYRLDGQQIVFEPQGAPAYATPFGLEGDMLIMDVPNYSRAVRFTRAPGQAP